MKVVTLLSGGLDSSALLGLMVRRNGEGDVRALSVDYGQRHRRELKSAQAVAAHLGVEWTKVQAPSEVFVGSALTSDIAVPEGHYTDASMGITVVPNRNMVLIALAAAYALGRECDAVAYAAHAGDHAIYPDCRPEFMAHMQRALSFVASPREFRLLTPFSGLTKAEIVREGMIAGVPLDLTYSCYNGRELHCGRCGTCVERREAFAVADVVDPTPYEGGN